MKQFKTNSNMKKIYTYLTLLLLAMSPAMFTSCDTDDYWYDDYDDWYENEDDRYNKPYDEGCCQLVSMAQTLNGMWSGKAKNVVYENNNAYETQIYVDFTFTQYSKKSNNGVGYETDYVQATTKTAARCSTPTARLHTIHRQCSLSGTSTRARTIYIWSMSIREHAIYSTITAEPTTPVSSLDGATSTTRRYSMA